jgi:ammonia channel protein AmtB
MNPRFSNNCNKKQGSTANLPHPNPSGGSSHSGGIAGTLVSQLRSGKPDLTFTINGILAGLVGVTAGCDAISMPAAWVIGFIGGALVVDAVSFVDALGNDDPVGAFSVHGFGGIWGTLAVGLFHLDKGLLTGYGFGQLGLQILGVVSYVVFTLAVSWILWSVLGAIGSGLSRLRFHLQPLTLIAAGPGPPTTSPAAISFNRQATPPHRVG